MAGQSFWDNDTANSFGETPQNDMTQVMAADPVTTRQSPDPLPDGPQPYETDPAVSVSFDLPMLSSIFTIARQFIEAENTNEMMLVLSAGQSLSFGTTLQSRFDPVWDTPVDADRAFMLDFNHNGISARGWNRLEVDATRFDGLIPMVSHVTETPAPSVVAHLLDGYDNAGRIAPNMLNVGTSAIGASLLELMTSADDLMPDLATGMVLTGDGDIFAVARSDGLFDYYLNVGPNVVHLDTQRFAPGLWDTMEAQLSFAIAGMTDAGYALHDQIAMSFVHGQADADLDHPSYGYAWALTRYLDMIESELAAQSGRDDLTLTVALAQVPGDADANVAFDQLQMIQNDPRVHYGGTQWEFQTVYGANPGVDNIHLSPEGYVHLGQSVGTYLAKAVLGRSEDPIVMDTITQTASDTLLVRFVGVEGHLVADPRIFDGNPDVITPDAFGFALTDLSGTDAPNIIAADIVGDTAVRLVFDGTLSGDYRLDLGVHGQDLSDAHPDRSFESYNATILRDSEPTDSMITPSEYSGDNLDIFEFAPIQYRDFSADLI